MATKPKKKFVPLFHEGGTAADRMVVLLPGRHPCQCLAVRHQLVGNCTACGRIVCEQEGPGSCFFCGAMVLTPEQRKLVQSSTNAARKLLNRLHSTPWAPGTPTPPCVNKSRGRHRRGGGAGGSTETTSCENRQELGVTESQKEQGEWAKTELDDTDYEDDDLLQEYNQGIDAQKRLEDGLVTAVLQRDRLLHFDATTAQRTRVIDDELDYFVSEGSGAAAAWLDPETRARVAKRVEELRAQRHASRLDSSRLCIDFANKCVYEEDTRGEAAQKLYSAEADVLSQKLVDIKTPSTTSFSTVPLSDPLINVPTPQFVSDMKPGNQRPETSDSKSQKTQDRKRGAKAQSRPGLVQDSEQNRLVDNGFCLSMHQPWASLLVRGIKKDEGRTWYSAHRGPLWIAAAAKVPEDFEIQAVEEECISHGAQKSDFPKSYPTGCLLGRVMVDDVLPQSEYRARFPNGASTSPFVFVCSDPRELLMKLPMQGAHKIYKLDPTIHTSAKANLA